MKAPHHIVSTKVLRPELVHQLEAIGAKVTQHNFINTRIDLPENLSKESIQDVIVLTSKMAVEALIRIADSLQLNMNKHRIYCLSEGTKKLVLDKGFRVDGTAANSSLLADEIINDGNIRSVTYLCGNLRRDNLPDQLKYAGIKVHEVIAYNTVHSPITIKKPSDAVLFFSPSAVDSYLSENKAGLSVAFCLGETTSSYALERGFTKVYVGDVHTSEALVKTIIDHYKNKKAHA